MKEGEFFCPNCGSPVESDTYDNSDRASAVKKKEPRLWIVVIVAAAAIAVILSFLSILSTLINYSRLPYSPGTITESGDYINEWADMRFIKSDGWTVADKSFFAQYSDNRIDCGYFATDSERGAALLIQFENLSMYTDKVTEDEYYQKYKALFEEQLTAGYGSDFECQEDVISIAGRDFRAVKYSHKDQFTYCCMRIKGDHTILVSMSCDSERVITDTLDSFKRDH